MTAGGGVPQGGGGPRTGQGGGRGGGVGRGGGGGSGLPPEILADLRKRKKNSKVVSLDFKVPNMPGLPSEEEVWDWLAKRNLTDDEVHEVDYFEREVIEKKYYVCMKEELGADWLAGKFEAGLKFKVSEEVEVVIKGRKEGEQWSAVVVRGVHPTTEIKAVEAVFKQFGEVKEVAFVSMGPRQVKSNKLNLKVKLEEGRSLPGFVMAPTGEGAMARWEVINRGLGGLRVCLQCYQQGHIRKNCPNQAATMADVVEGKAGAAISYAQVLAGRKPNQPVAPVQQLPPLQQHEPNARPVAIQDSASLENGAAVPGRSPGETVSDLLLRSSDASATQALETTMANDHTNASSMEKLNPTLNAPGGTAMPAGTLTGHTVDPLLSSDTSENLVKQASKKLMPPPEIGAEVLAKIRKLKPTIPEDQLQALVEKEIKILQRESGSCDRKRKDREEKGVRSSSEKRKKEDSRSPTSEELKKWRQESGSEKRKEDERKSRQDHLPHKSQHGKHRSDSHRPPSRNNGYHN